MVVTITFTRYRIWLAPFGILSMAVFRIPLLLNRKVRFWKLMGTGRNGTFDKTPDLLQWSVLTVWQTREEADRFLKRSFTTQWQRILGHEQLTLWLAPLEYRGSWDGKQPFGSSNILPHDGMIAVLTRATIRINKLKSFWENVDPVAKQMSMAKGFIHSWGIGEIPWIKQATFSLWESKEAMKDFAYKLQEHAEVIRKTRKEKWYSEELFARFSVIDVEGENDIAKKIRILLSS